jgi:hypothetical protein
MAYNLPTNTVPGSSGHTALHNQVATAVNDLDTRAASLEGSVPAQIFIPASAFSIVSGTPLLTSAAPVAWQRWLLDPGSTEIVNTALVPPLGWTTAKARIHWSSESTQTGNAVIQLRALPVKSNGDVLTSGESSQNLLLDVPDQSVLSVNDYATAINVATADPLNRPLLQISIRRLGADATDTYPNDISLIGVSLIKVS